MPARRVTGPFARLILTLCVVVGIVFSTSSSKVGARTPLPANITGPIQIGLGGSYSEVMSVSETGYIVGSSALPGDAVAHLFLRKPNGDIVDLGVEPAFSVVSNNGNIASYRNNAGGAFYSEATGWLEFDGVPQPINGTIEPGDVATVIPAGVTSSGAVFGIMWSSRPSCGCSSDGQHFFRWTRDGGTVDLGNNNESYAEIYGVNEAGQFAGTVNGFNPGHGLRWSPAEGFIDLGTLPGHDYNLRTFGMSEAGHVTGFQYFPELGSDAPFGWSPASGLMQLGTGSGDGTNVNARGQFAGTISGAGTTVPFFMDSATAAMETIAGPFTYAYPAMGPGTRGLNGRGQLVGEGYLPGTFERRGFYWSAADGLVNLGGQNSRARGITNSGMIVGDSDGHAAIWQVTGVTAADVTAPTVTLTSPSNGTYSIGQLVIASYSCGDDAELISCSAPVANGAAIDTTTPGPHGFTVTAIDRFDNVTTKTVVYNTPDNVAPTVTTNIADGDRVNQDEYFPFKLRCVDAGGIDICRATDENGQELRNDSQLNSAAGAHTITITATDKSGNNSNRVIHYTAAPDTFAPTVTIASPVNGGIYSYGQAATVSFSCVDQSGVSMCGPAQVQGQSIGDGSALPTLTSGTQTLTVRARDNRGNEGSVSVTYTVLAGPDAAIASPVARAQFHVGDAVSAAFTCSSPLGVVACNGTVANGAAIDTSAPGDFTFSVSVTDNGGFSRSIDVPYSVLANDVPSVGLSTPPSGGFLGPIDLGTLGGSYSEPSMISANGIIVGRSSVANDTTTHAFVWTQANGMKDLGNVDPHAVSTNATIVGSGSMPQPGQTMMQVGYHRAFAWTPSGGVRMLASPEFEIDATPRRGDDIYGGSEAQFVNSSGLAAGALLSWRVSLYMGPFAFYNTIQRPVMWKANGDILLIPTVGNSMYLLGLDDAGHALLQVDLNGQSRAMLWSEAGGFLDLGDLGGGYAQASQVNAGGSVIGTSSTSDGSQHAFVWTAAGGMVDLGEQFYPSSVNSSGQVVGYNPALGSYGLWTQATGMVRLQDLGSGFATAGWINASGQIFGESYTSGYAEHRAATWTADGTVTDLGLVDGIRGLSDNHISAGVAGNHAVVWLLPGFAPDTTVPSAAVTTPADGAALAQNTSTNAAFACSDARGIASCAGSAANGSPIDTSATGTFAFSVTAVDNNGNYAVTTTHYTVSASTGGGGTTPGHMHADGYVTAVGDSNERQRFAFDVLARPTGQHHLRFNFWTVDPDDNPRRANVFDATSITAVHFSDDPAFTSGHSPNAATIDSVTFSGTGIFNGQAGYSFEVTATDKGEPGANLDTFQLTVKDGNGVVVFTSGGGAIAHGNIQSLRLPNRHFPPFLSGGPERVRDVEATGAGGAVVTFDLPTAVDESGNTLTVTCTPQSGSTFALGRTKGTCTATDANGRKGSMVFVVIVSDNTAPVFSTQPSNLTMEATSQQGADVTFALPAATDVVDTAVSVDCNPDPGRKFHLGSTLVTCKARDNSGNTAVTTFTVTVRDTTPPMITGTPANITAEATSAAGRKVTYTKPSATDIGDNSVAVNCAPASNTTFARGTTTVTCTAADNAGNTATTSFTVTVIDTTAPAITLSKPAQGAEYKLGQTVVANFTCKDDGAGIASCVGTVADGAAINTASLGTKTFTVTAIDLAGNQTIKTVTYTVKPK